jgi:hypothetical protein
MSSHIKLDLGKPVYHLTAPSPQDAPPVVVTAPIITGSGKIGTEHFCEAGTWANDPTYEYQWKKMQAGNPAVLPGATTRVYVPTNQDANKEIFCTVLATNAFGVASSDSNMITVLPPVVEAGL